MANFTLTKAAHSSSTPSFFTFHNKSPSHIHCIVLFTQCISLAGNSAVAHSSLTADPRLPDAALAQYRTPVDPLSPHMRRSHPQKDLKLSHQHLKICPELAVVERVFSNRIWIVMMWNIHRQLFRIFVYSLCSQCVKAFKRDSSPRNQIYLSV